MVAIGTGVVIVVRGLAGEIATVVGAGERQTVTLVVQSKVGLIGSQRVHVFHACLVVGPIAVVLRHDREDKLILVPHVGIEVDMAGAAVILECRQDIGGTRTEDMSQRVFHLSAGERRLGGVLYGRGVDTVPCNLTIGVTVVGIDGIARQHHASTVDQTVAAFPFNHSDVVGNAKLFFNQGRKRVVEGTARIVAEVDHSHAVLVAIVEGDGAAVAEPEGVACADDKLHIVATQAHTVQFADDGTRVGSVLPTGWHP